MNLAADFIVICLCLQSLVFASSATPSKTAPNVFLITIDTLRADHVHCYGYDKVQTPALDALAKDGMRFSEAFTPSPITNTSHASILTGLLPGSHGVTDFAVPLSPSHPTLAERLHKQGYRTAAFIGAVILDSKTLAPGFDRGFDFYDNFPEAPSSKSRWGRVERRGMDVVQHAESWLGRHAAGPHFMWVHLYDPHDPYEPPPPYSETYKDHLYDGEIAYADSALGHFVAYLKAHDEYRNSIVIVVGDHGEGLGEHHEDTHGIFLYDSTTHVPLIMKLPGQAHAAAVIDAQVRTIDIVPTILDLVHAPPLEKADGTSLTSYLSKQDEPGRVALGETDYPLRFGWSPLRSVRTETYKFIAAPRPELYDLRADPGELKNQYKPDDPQVEKARTILTDTAKAEAQSVAGPDASGEANTAKLKALGYADSSAKSSDPAASLPDPKDKIEEQNLLHKAMLASEDDRAAEARQYLEKVLALDPADPTALRQLGELEFKAADYAHAAQHLKAALKVRPDDATAAFDAGQAMFKSGDFAGARDALESSLKLLPGQFPARLLLGQVYLALKNPKSAEDQLEAALLIQPENVEAQLALADAQMQDGNFAEVVPELETLSKSQPENADVFESLSKAYAASGKSSEAQQAKARADELRSIKH